MKLKLQSIRGSFPYEEDEEDIKKLKNIGFVFNGHFLGNDAIEINIESINDLFDLVKKIGYEIIITEDGLLQIYNGYIE